MIRHDGPGLSRCRARSNALAGRLQSLVVVTRNLIKLGEEDSLFAWQGSIFSGEGIVVQSRRERGVAESAKGRHRKLGAVSAMGAAKRGDCA